MADKKLGKVTHFYDKIGVAVLELTGAIKIGDQVKFVKNEEEFEQTVDSLQLDRKEIKSAKKGDDVAIKVDKPVKTGTLVYLVS